MFTFISLLILLLTTTTTQPYKPTDEFFLNCGTSSTSDTTPRWDGDENSNFVPPNVTTTSFSSTIDGNIDPSFTQVPYYTARIINASSFTYTFPVSQGPKFLRLHFYPATYSGLKKKESFFSVTANGYSLLTNFSAFLTASYIKDAHVMKEYIVYVNDTQRLNVTFTPSPNSYAFINGIEIVSIPTNLYLNAKYPPKYFAQTSGLEINEETALEAMYRLNMGGQQIPGENDTGMNRVWEQDDNYIFGAHGRTPVYNDSIMYTTDTPNYTAPDPVYRTQRSMGNQSERYNLTWILPVDSGFYYMLRLHFCNIIPEYQLELGMIFTIYVNNQTAEAEADLFRWAGGSGHPVFKDYALSFNDPAGGKQDLWLALHPNAISGKYLDAVLNGLEVFKVSMLRNLAGPTPDPKLDPITPSTSPNSSQKKNKNRTTVIVIAGGVVGALVLLSILVLVVLWRIRSVKHYGRTTDDVSSYDPVYGDSKSTKSTHSTLPSDRCRRFSLTEVKVATDEFNDNCVIGHGGFGKVYKGYMDNATTTVAIKRLNESSNQGAHEFQTEIVFLSKLRHVQLVSLIGYCVDEEEMILVYDYMAHGTLREHLYKTNKPHLSWKRRLDICIGAAKGLHYLHEGAKRSIIHRDVKSTNILLDKNWVAKLSDFGLSKLGPRDQAQNHVSTAVKGSFGYMDPEYYRTQQLTEKSDVYSFGVVLLEVLCARPVMIPGLVKEQVNLAEWGKLCYRKGTLNKIIDSKLKGAIAPECLRQFADVAICCLMENSSDRPAMDAVVWGLEFAKEVQEAVEKTVGESETEDQERPFMVQVEQTTTDDDLFLGSTAVRNGTPSISSSDEGFKSQTVFSEIQKPTAR
ncbi:receptor-like protein kinase FERONIA [Rutidosis leptorrhynchoides]|uniref:receptor-like protein kinase FERONIA n=1 Tax=Rutidosis leptorrhynchoides TaxID=125765 RepID=UPI003A994A52